MEQILFNFSCVLDLISLLRLQNLFFRFWNKFVFSNLLIWFWLSIMRDLRFYFLFTCTFLIELLILIWLIQNFISSIIIVIRVSHNLIINCMLSYLFLLYHYFIILVFAIILVLSVKVRSRSKFISHISLNNIWGVLSFFKSFCVSESIQSMVCWRFTWINTSNHYNSWLIFIANKWISKNHCQFSLSKWYVSSWNFCVHCSDAFF